MTTDKEKMIISNLAADEVCLHGKETINCLKSTNTTPTEKSTTSEQTNHLAQNVSSYLDLTIIQKILNKFLMEKNMSKKSLTEALDLKLNELEAILNNQASSELIAKINLPLIKLFCKTKFND